MGAAGSFLVVGWDGGGNTGPLVGLGRRLAQAGHSVRILGPTSMQERVEKQGCAFVPFRYARHPDPVGGVMEENLMDWLDLFCGPGTARDVAEEVERQPADCLVIDCMLPTALGAGERSGLPYAALLHLRHEFFTVGPGSMLWEIAREPLTSTRQSLGLANLEADRSVMGQLWERATVALAMLPEVFDQPRSNAPAGLRHVGPILDEPPSGSDDGGWTHPAERLVLVSFSTTNMGQEPVLQRALDAVADIDAQVLCTRGGVPTINLRAPSNATIVDWVPHASVVPHSDVVVTHGGLSTVMTALAYGVPLVCMPMGRDQYGNAERVSALGAGMTIEVSSPPEIVRSAVVDVMSSSKYSKAARRLADVIATYGNGARAVAELEGLLYPHK